MPCPRRRLLHMKVTYNWLKEFVDIKISASALADKLTMAGLEVKASEEKRGDFVFEIEITSNRPDWLSVIGVAREVAAITGKKLKKLPVASRQSSGKEKVNIEIENKKDCLLYIARIIRGVKVEASPQWLKDRLELVGVRSVNNVVDITNYVLFELGEPLHAFDLDKFNRNGGSLDPSLIAVRRARDNEALITIDGENRKLNPGILVIVDRKKPVAVAGVMGGKDTEVGADTKNIILESAIFNPVTVRRGRQKLGMNSDASYRFERGIDPEIVEMSSLRAARLIAELCGGVISAVKSSGAAARKSPVVELSADDVSRYLGKEIPAVKLKNIFQGLGFSLGNKNKNVFKVKVPSWRLDVKSGIDLVEEAARIYGYENIPSTLASVVLRSLKSQTLDNIPLIKDFLTGLGLNEVITHSLIDRKSLEGFWDKDELLIEVANPLSSEQEVMRPLLMPSLSGRVAYNLRQQNAYINIFEIAKTYVLDAGKAKEKYSLGIALCGAKLFWLGPKQGYVQDSPGFLHLKGVLEALWERLGIEGSGYRFLNSSEVEVFIGNEKIGVLKKLSREILSALDIKNKDVFLAEIYLEEKILPLVRLKRKFNAAGVPRYPGITRDITLQVESEVTLEEILTAVYAAKEPLLASAVFQGCYEGEKVPPGTKRITISLRYASAERTLTEEEVAPSHDRLVQALEAKLQIKK